MSENQAEFSLRKKEHLTICEDDSASFKSVQTGFDRYTFLHDATTEVIFSDINLESDFFGKTVAYPFLISCMTGGTDEANNINLRLAEVANTLNIPLGLGSMRYALESRDFDIHLKGIKKAAGNAPIMTNIGAAQLCEGRDVSQFQRFIDIIEADVFVIHLNPLQELVQRGGEPAFPGLMAFIEVLTKSLTVPIVVKEVGSGISKQVAKRLLEAGVKGIDVAGAGGTSWSAVEIIRNRDDKNNEFWDWGLPTAYCLRTVRELKEFYKFTLISSGGVNTPHDAAVSYALGANFTGSARKVLQALHASGEGGVIIFITQFIDYLKKVLFLTGSASLAQLQVGKLIRKEELI